MEVDIVELQKNLLDYLQQSKGKDIVITQDGKKIAVITNPERYSTSKKTKSESLADALTSIGGVNFDWEVPEREAWKPKKLF